MDETAGVTIRPARPEDFDGWFALYEDLAAEGRWIGGEPPLDRADRRRAFEGYFDATSMALHAFAGERFVGMLGLNVRRGLGELAMMLAADWRGRGVGSRLLAGAIAWAREHDVHKIALEVWPHNAAAIALYRRAGFVEEGRLRRHYRRRSGELWDAIAMGLVLDEDSPGGSL